MCGGQTDIGQDFSWYFGFRCQFSFHQLLHILQSSYHPTKNAMDIDIAVAIAVFNSSIKR
jgi:hypothetical protein